jgi:hypothetical protein
MMVIVKTSLYVPATSGLAGFFSVTLTLNGALTGAERVNSATQVKAW